MTRMFRLSALVLLLGFVSAPLFAGDDKDEATYRKIESQLESTTIDSLAYEEADVTEVVKDIAKKARITIVIDSKALEDVDEDDRVITLELAEVKASNALNIVLDQIKLVKMYKNGVLYITNAEKAQGAVTTKVYDVRDITVKIVDFPAPKLRLRAADDSGGGPIIDYGDEPDDPTVDDIVEMVEESVEADWGGAASVSIVKGQLVVRASREVHKDVADLLDQLRSAK
ncbi:MAG: hypothetical protein H6840_03665 [Planctomycetes bacterium]|nr:hypothetical protein [Planctomycetota bacterium]